MHGTVTDDAVHRHHDAVHSGAMPCIHPESARHRGEHRVDRAGSTQRPASGLRCSPMVEGALYAAERWFK